MEQGSVVEFEGDMYYLYSVVPPNICNPEGGFEVDLSQVKRILSGNTDIQKLINYVTVYHEKMEKDAALDYVGAHPEFPLHILAIYRRERGLTNEPPFYPAFSRAGRKSKRRTRKHKSKRV